MDSAEDIIDELDSKIWSLKYDISQLEKENEELRDKLSDAIDKIDRYEKGVLELFHLAS